MMYEACRQLQGKGGSRQIKDVELAMTHNLGVVWNRHWLRFRHGVSEKLVD